MIFHAELPILGPWLDLYYRGGRGSDPSIGGTPMYMYRTSEGLSIGMTA